MPPFQINTGSFSCGKAIFNGLSRTMNENKIVLTQRIFHRILQNVEFTRDNIIFDIDKEQEQKMIKSRIQVMYKSIKYYLDKLLKELNINEQHNN